MGRLPKGKRIIIILDGLDELAESDSAFAQEIPLSLSFESVLWLCAGRPERGLPEAFTPKRCQHVFPEGLSPMSTGDVRTMLLEKIGPLRKRLVRNDREQDSVVVNPFIDRVSEYAAGLPIYVTYVIGDILSNRFRALDAGERLPPSLVHYHEELLRRCSVGILQQLLTPLAASVAVSLEPMTAQVLTQLMIHGNVLPDDGSASGLVAKGLSSLGAMLRRTSSPEGKEGFSLFHHSLRLHMHSSPNTRGALSTALVTFCSRACFPDCEDSDLSRYFCRWGNVHLLQSGKEEGVIKRLRDSGYVERKATAVGWEYIMNDLRELAALGHQECLIAFDIALSNHAVEATAGWYLFTSLPSVPPVDKIEDLLREGSLAASDIRDVFTSSFRYWNQAFSLNFSRMQILDEYYGSLARAFRATAKDDEISQLVQTVNEQFLSSTHGMGRDYRLQPISAQEEEPIGRFEQILDILGG